jgi:hypothetical protein
VDRAVVHDLGRDAAGHARAVAASEDAEAAQRVGKAKALIPRIIKPGSKAKTKLPKAKGKAPVKAPGKTRGKSRKRS